jgi:GNAT superfamily N-acetyltransferase
MTRLNWREESGPWLDHAMACDIQAARHDTPTGYLGVHRWYLRRRSGPVADSRLPRAFFAMRCEQPPVSWYRYLYNLVGEDWLWYEAKVRPDAAIAAKLAMATTSITVLIRDGVPMGFYELDRFASQVVDLAYFGLAPWAIGRGLGRRFLLHAVREAEGEKNDLTVNTCTLDHPAALTLYQKAGFEIERQVSFQDPDPRLSGHSPREAAPHIPLAH